MEGGGKDNGGESLRLEIDSLSGSILTPLIQTVRLQGMQLCCPVCFSFQEVAFRVPVGMEQALYNNEFKIFKGMG